MKRLLAATANRLGPAPRTARPYGVVPPHWLASERLRETYRDAPTLLAHGTLTWGRFLQANSGLFQPTGHDAPGTMMYATDLRADITPDQLERAAMRCYALKGTTPVDEEGLRVARLLTNEYSQHGRVPLPLDRTDGVPMTMTLAMVHRAHLPCGYLATMLVPILVHAEIDIALILPCSYWADDLRRGWLDLSAEP